MLLFKFHILCFNLSSAIVVYFLTLINNLNYLMGKRTRRLTLKDFTQNQLHVRVFFIVVVSEFFANGNTSQVGNVFLLPYKAHTMIKGNVKYHLKHINSSLSAVRCSRTSIAHTSTRDEGIQHPFMCHHEGHTFR